MENINNTALLTTTEAAARLGVSRQTMYVWRRLGHLVPVKFGPTTVRYRECDIQAILNGRAKN